MIRILHVVGIMNVGGIESWLMNVYRNINRSKIQFDFVVHSNNKGYFDDEIEKLEGKIFRVPKFSIVNLLQYKREWTKLMDNNKYHIIHSHIRSSAPIFLKIAKQYNYTTISHAHSISNGKFFESLVKGFFQRNIVKYSDICFACSIEAGKWLFKSNNFRVIKNAINVSAYSYNELIRNEYRRKYNIEKEDIVIGHIGRFSYPKNHNFLIDIFAELCNRNDKFKLILIGDGKLRNKIEKKIEFFHLEKNIILTGIRSDISQFLQMMDIFLFPSLYEGLGIALIEAQSAGLICFISDTIPKEVIINSHSVHPISLKKSINDWANIIIKNLDYNREDVSTSMKMNGYDIHIVAKELEDLYCAI